MGVAVIRVALALSCLATDGRDPGRARGETGSVFVSGHLNRAPMVSSAVGVGLALLGAGLLLVLGLWARGRRGRSAEPEPSPEPLVDEEATWSPTEVGPPLPGEDAYVRCVQELASLCYDESPLGRVREHWEADPASEPGLEHPVLIEVEVDGVWHHIEPRYRGHRIDVETLVTDLNQLLPDDGPRLVLLDGDPPRVGVARWQELP